MDPNDNVAPFEADAAKGGGYVYTTSERLSSRLATQRTTDIILERGAFSGRSVLDVGCGDGHFTMKWWDQGQPKRLAGMDAAKSAIDAANAKKGARNIEFTVGDAHKLPWADNSFDLVLLQSVLHHDDDPGDMIREAFRVAPEVLIHEPNGNNLALKVIERVSKYHREHKERSYWWWQFNRWVKKAGGRIVFRRYAGFVPMFCSDGMAKFTKQIEPMLEHMPVLNAMGCAIVLIHAVRPKS